ncbi:hypothetical protein L208DRAFT_1389895 [Tricholoma matsutake]|nr:hypothetical protein L208DRAFT_1389895 [Tricholoma matsutake 945]
MSGYSSDGQGTLSISSSESNTGLRGDEDNSSFSWGEEEHTMSRVAEQEPSLPKLKIRLPASDVPARLGPKAPALAESFGFG